MLKKFRNLILDWNEISLYFCIGKKFDYGTILHNGSADKQQSHRLK